MPKITYVRKVFSDAHTAIIDKANEIIEAYAAQGYDLTLRQLYYQFVARDLIRNTMQEYKRLGGIVNDARLAGLIDWEHITDRTRNLHRLAHWSTPGEIVEACVSQYRIDMWASQPTRVEVWIEKEALAGVFQRICDELRVPMFACRGYTSQSEMWVAGQRLAGHMSRGQDVKILHFGDHDPSGIDMTRDIRDRLKLFMGGIELERLALNMDQVDKFQPPPNPAKITDSRAKVYIQEYGDESWELDALEPSVLAGLVRDFVEANRDDAAWEAAGQVETAGRKKLREVSRTL